MKKFLFILIFLGLCSTAWATDYTALSSCKGAWLFTEGSGTTVDNAQGTATFDGSFSANGKPTWYNTSLTNLPTGVNWGTRYTKFQGSTRPSCYNIDSGDLTGIEGATKLTASFWIRLESVDVTSGAFILGKFSQSDATRCFKVTLKNDSGLGEIAFAMLNGNWCAKSTTNADLGTSTWYHIAVLWTANNTVTIYVDGNSKSIGTDFDNGGSGTLQATTTTFQMGYNTDELTEPIDGELTEVAIFSDNLSSTEINDIMDNGLKPAVGGGTIKTFHSAFNSGFNTGFNQGFN